MPARVKGKDPVLVVIQLTGGLDFMNTVIPYTEGIYYDSRPTVAIARETMLPINSALAFHPAAARLKELYDAGNVAIVQGIGYENSSRSHFRGMDIWHTCEPVKIAINTMGKKSEGNHANGWRSVTRTDRMVRSAVW